MREDMNLIDANRRPRRARTVVVGALAAAALLVLPAAARPRDAAGPTAPTGPYANGTVLPNGRLVTPASRTVDLGDFPLGVAVSPDGRLAVSVNSGQGDGTALGTGGYCGLHQDANCPPGATGAGAPAQPDESLDVTNLRTGRTTVVKAVPTDPSTGSFNFFYVGVAFSPDGRHLYAAGGGNDAVYDFPVRRDVVGSRPLKTVTVADTFKSEPAIPALGPGNAFTKGLAVTPDGRYLLVTQEFQNALTIIDTRTYASRQVSLSPPSAAGGAYPYGVAVSPDGRTAYVAEQGLNGVAVVTLNGGSGVLATPTPIQVGDHPTALALSPDGARLYVANADDDTLSILSVDKRTGLPAPAATVTLHAVAGEALGVTPNALAVSPDGRRVYVALAGDDAVAVLDVSGPVGAALPAPPLLGMIPTGWYPSAVATSPDVSQVYAVSAKGLGSRSPGTNVGAALVNSYYSQKTNMFGLLQIVAKPDAAALAAGLVTVRQDIQFATNVDTGRGAHNPIPAAPVTSPAALSAATPIKYVIEIVKENRTFDQEMGDLAADEGRNRPGTDTVNGQPAYVTFGRDVTPNAHALLGDPTGGPTAAFATSDNFYSDGEASVQGHWWTAAANVNDYVEKSWRQYYSNRNHVQDTVSPVSTPHNCTIFQNALLRQAADPTFSFRDYGELIGVANPSVPSLTTILPGLTNSCAALPDANFSLAASSQLTLTQDDRKTARGFLGDVGLNADGTQTVSGTLGLAYLHNFSYIIMGGDHTYGLNGYSSPRAIVAQNDAGLGMVIAALSRSKYWPNTAIFVMEDDSQDGLDHVDGHRNLLYVVSPYARHQGLDGKPGYVSHLHYSQASALKTIDLLTGLPYLSTYDQNATALYDLFQNKDGTPGHTLTPDDLAFYTTQPAPPFIDETAAQVKSRLGVAADVLTAESKRLDVSGIDRAGPELEIIDWQLAHPDRPVPPQLLRERRAWAAGHSGGLFKDGDG